MKDPENGSGDEGPISAGCSHLNDRAPSDNGTADIDPEQPSDSRERDAVLRLVGGRAMSIDVSTSDGVKTFIEGSQSGHAASRKEFDDKVRPITGGYLKKGASQIEIERHVLLHIRKNLMEVPEHVVRSGESDSIKLSESDIKALEHEYWFKIRFGFTLGPKGRIAMFEAIDQYDFSDEEVRKLHRAGAISWDGQTLRIKASKPMMRLGWGYVAGLSVLAAIPWGTVMFSTYMPLWSRAILGAIGSLFCMLIYVVHGTLIVPYNLGKRAKASTPRTLSHPGKAASK